LDTDNNTINAEPESEISQEYTEKNEPTENNTEQNTDEQTVQNEQNKIVYINFTPPDPADADFWGDVSRVSPSKRLRRLPLIICTVLLVAAICGYAVILAHGKGWFSNLFNGSKQIEFTLPIAETPELDDKYYNDDGSYTAAGLAKAVLTSVVQIQVYSENSLIPSSQGSGIIISDDGYIVTNAHVISDADFGVTVLLYDETAYSAKIVGSDESTDIAVLKIGAHDLTPAQFADSDNCELGDDVVAIGSPAGYENSVTKGIISGLDRQIHAENSATAMTCIQIDAAINPGNSGGPLFNMWGQVIGITSSKLVSTSYDNIGFAITVNSAKPIIEELMEYGYIPDKPRIGISYYTITEDSAELHNIEAGIYVAEIDSDCNVAETDLQVGDIIIEMNGVKPTDEDAVSEIMSNLKAGDQMTCKVYRPSEDENADISDGEYFEITFELNSDKTSMIEASENNSSESE
jgi:serine protease Do